MNKIRHFLPYLASLIVVLLLISTSNATTRSEDELIQFISGDYEQKMSANCYDLVKAIWDFETDITPEHAATVAELTLRNSAAFKQIHAEWFADVDVDKIKNATLKRMFEELNQPGVTFLSDNDLKNLSDINTMMVDAYSTAKICPFTDQNCDLEKSGLKLEPEIKNIIATSTDYDELLYIWKTWRDATGTKIRDMFKIHLVLNNEVAHGNNFSDYGEFWREMFDAPDFDYTKDLDEIWRQVSPLYKLLHNFASQKLKERYGDKLDNSDGLLPAHVFGNMWAKNWENLQNILLPYPNETKVNITEALIDKKFTVLKMFETSDDFYTSLGLPSNKVSFGDQSMITRPEGKEVVCDPSAWEFCDKKTYLIKMCAQVNGEDFMTIHRQMAQIEYAILYKDQLNSFLGAANPGFYDAFSEAVALSVKSIIHLKRIGLVSNDYKDTMESNINDLMKIALDTIAYLPFGFLVDKYRWDVFSGKVSESEWNKHWWDLRAKYQLLKPPVERSEEDFDPGAIFELSDDTYFISQIMQFQFYRHLCIVAGEYDPVTKQPPLNKCDFYKSTKAGDVIKEALSLGCSKPWPEVLQIIAGTDKLDASALMEYFEPLIEYLKQQGYDSTS